MLLIRIELSVNKMLQILLIIRTQIRDRPRGLAVTGPDVAGARIGKRAVIAGAFAEAVEPLRAVRLRTGPFADDGPLVGARELRAQSTGGGDVVGWTHGDLGRGEDLVLVGVEEDVLVARRRLGHEAVPVGLEVFKGVMDAGCVITTGAGHGLVARLVEGFDLVEIEVGTERFIEELDGRDDVGVARVMLGEALKCGDGLADRVALLPINRAVTATVVEAIL